MRTPKPSSTPKWKQIILSTPEWPEDLSVPQNEVLPADSECIQESMFTNEHWEWELWRDEENPCYFLKVWPIEDPKAGDADGPGVALTLTEAFQFLMVNLMPRDVVADLAFEHPELLKSLQIPPPAPGLN